MNDRIDEIAMIANAQTGNKFDLNHKELDTFLKKYAELIVKRSAEVSFFECAYVLPINDCEQIRNMIVERFGVE